MFKASFFLFLCWLHVTSYNCYYWPGPMREHKPLLCWGSQDRILVFCACLLPIWWYTKHVEFHF
jgi:hypothetical protein